MRIPDLFGRFGAGFPRIGDWLCRVRSTLSFMFLPQTLCPLRFHLALVFSHFPGCPHALSCDRVLGRGLRTFLSNKALKIDNIFDPRTRSSQTVLVKLWVTVGARWCPIAMATFREVQLNAIEKKLLTKHAEDLYRSTNCKLVIGGKVWPVLKPVFLCSFQGRGRVPPVQASLPEP